MRPIYFLLIFLPLAVLAELLHWPPLVIFGASALAVVPLAGLLGEATEVLADKIGPRFGGLLNATLGNAAELIITIIAIRAGQLTLVKASLIGSVIGNILLVLGAEHPAGRPEKRRPAFQPRERRHGCHHADPGSDRHQRALDLQRRHRAQQAGGGGAEPGDRGGDAGHLRPGDPLSVQVADAGRPHGRRQSRPATPRTAGTRASRWASCWRR